MAAAALAQQPIPLANDKIAVEILPAGASIVSLIRKDDPAKLNPLWSPGPQAGRGHFLCLDGFGAPSKEEQAAGLRFHGEAVAQTFEIVSQQGGALSLRAKLPLLQETVTRTYRVFSGEPVLWVETEVESHTGFDRPMVWGEHATIGAPFLEPELTVVDMSATRAQTRPYVQRPGALPRRLARGQDFIWPDAPGADGKTIDLRRMPSNPNSVDHTTQLMDPSKPIGWATALHTGKRVLVGWVFRREEFPWMQNWENYPPDLKKAARGLEFATQPYDIPRREAVDMGRLFGTPTFKWLPAKSKVSATFLVFLTEVPPKFSRVDAIRFEGRSLVVEDRAAGLTVSIPVSRTL
jgi:hypothetical protein